MQMMLAKGADVNARDDEVKTALMEAASNGRFEVVEALLAKGADANIRD